LASKLKKLCTLLLAVIVLGVSIPDVSLQVQAAETDTTLYGHTLIAENDQLQLYFYEPTLSVIVKDKATGEIMESTLRDELDDGSNNDTWEGFMKSGVVIKVIDGTNDTLQADLINNEHTLDVTYTDNGFSAVLYYKDYDFGLTMNVSLEDDGLVVSIPDDSIIENSDRYYIASISPYPMLGYSYLDAHEGYMFVPDGNGALIYLDNKEGRFANGFSEMVYGDDIGFKDSEVISLFWDKYQTVTDSEKVLAPIFGMVHTDSKIGYLGIIEGGEERAMIQAQPNGANIAYNRTYAEFIQRKVYVQPTSNSSSGSITQIEKSKSHYDIKVRYLFVSGDSANYSGLAVAYRNYLLNNNLLTKQEDSYKTRVDFLGADREEWLIFKKSVTMTTVDNIKEIYNTLQKDGVENVLSVYKGWQKGGLYSLPITTYRADSSVGGTAALTSLITDSAAQGYDLYLYNDSLRINPDENNTTFNVVKRISKRRYEESTYKSVYDTFLFLTPARTDSLLKKFIKSYTKKGVSNLAVAGITNQLFSYTYSGDAYSRTDCMEDYKKTIAVADENTNLALEQPFSYLWNNTSAFLDMPVGSSSYIYVDEEIPFISMVLKGILPVYSEYMNFEANKDEFFLNLVEMGMYPSFYVTYEDSSDLIYTNSSDIYSSKFSTYENEIVRYNKELKAVNEAVKGALIMKHERFDNNVVKVTYDNGVVIYVNYSDADVTMDGYTIGALSYKVGETNE